MTQSMFQAVPSEFPVLPDSKVAVRCTFVRKVKIIFLDKMQSAILRSTQRMLASSLDPMIKMNFVSLTWFTQFPQVLKMI